MRMYEVDIERIASTIKTFRVFAVDKKEAELKAFAKAERSFWDKDKNAQFTARNIQADA
jgi:hypothetical protein